MSQEWFMISQASHHQQLSGNSFNLKKLKDMKNDFMMHLVIVGGIILVFSLILKIIGVTF